MLQGVEEASKVVRRVVGDYLARGGIVTDGSRKLDSDMLASPSGGLPALLQWAGEFYDEWEIPFASLRVAANVSAYTGFELQEIAPQTPSLGSMLAFFTSYMHEDIFNVAISPALDLSGLLGEFPDWCRQQASAHEVPQDASMHSSAPVHQAI